MPRPNSERVVPTTAAELIASHEDITVVRDWTGVIRVAPDIVTRPCFLGFSTVLDMIDPQRQRPRSALRLESRLFGDARDTRLLIPTSGSLDDMDVVVRGRTDPGDVLAMATEGVHLLDDLHHLSPDEQRRLSTIPYGDRKVCDDMLFPGSDFLSEDLDPISPTSLVHGTFAAAKRILLGE